MNMKNKDLKCIFKDTTLKYDPDSSKKAIYDKYCLNILTLLEVLPDDVEIKGITYLEQAQFSSKDDFENFIKSDKDEVERTLDKLADRLTEWTKNYIDVQTAESSILYNKSNKKHISTKIFLTTIILTLIAAVVFSILDIAGAINYGNQISTAIGCLDLVYGGCFFLYEFFSDKQKNNVRTDAKQCAKEGNYNKFYNICKNSYNIILGHGNNIGDTENPDNSKGDTENKNDN